MVETIQTKGKDAFCNYSFETINIQGSNYRVPVQNRKNLGKVLDKAASGSNRLDTNGAEDCKARAENNRGKKGQDQRAPREEVNYTHFISIPIRDPIVRQNYE